MTTFSTEVYRDIALFVPVQQMKYVVDTMHQTSVDIFEQKKAALRLGEESVVKQVGMGKDIMSILCEYLKIFSLSTINQNDFPVRANLEVEDDERLPESELLGQMK